MVFAVRNLSVLAYANGFTLWHYKGGKERLEAACARAVAIGSLTRKSVVSILENHLDRQATLPVSQAEWHSPMHDNVRGPDYYH